MNDDFEELNRFTLAEMEAWEPEPEEQPVAGYGVAVWLLIGSLVVILVWRNVEWFM